MEKGRTGEVRVRYDPSVLDSHHHAQAKSDVQKKLDLERRREAVERKGHVMPRPKPPVELGFSWRKVDAGVALGSEMPEGRSGHCAFTLSSTDPRVFIHGGAADSKYFQDMYCYHTTLGKWMLAHTYLKPTPRAYLTTMLVQADFEVPKKEQFSRLLTFGGFFKGQLFGEVHMVDEWSVIKRGIAGKNEVVPPPQRRTDKPPPTSYNDIWRQADEVCGEIPLARCMHTATLVAGRHLVVVGGWHAEFVNDVYVLDVQTMVWEQKHCLMPLDDEGNRVPVAGRAGHSANLLPNRQLLVFGGQNKEGQLRDVLLLDLNRMEWSRPAVSGRPPCVRSGHTACYDGKSKVYVYGGWDGVRQRDDLHVLSVAGNPARDWRWEVVHVGGAHVGGRCGHAATMVNHKLWLFGGWSNGVFYNNVYVLEEGVLESEMVDNEVEAVDSTAARDQTDARKKALAEAQALAAEVEPATGKQRLAILQERLHAPGAMTEKQLALVQQDLESEMRLFKNEVAARKLRQLGEASERERRAVRAMAEKVAGKRRAHIVACMEDGYTMKEAIEITEDELGPDGELKAIMPAPTNENQMYLQIADKPPSKDNAASQDLVVHSEGARPVTPRQWNVSRQGRRRCGVPAAPAEPEIANRQRQAIFDKVSDAPYRRLEHLEEEYKAFHEDALGTIAATGGLASCYDDVKRQDFLDKAARKLQTESTETGALAAALASAEARKLVETHPDTFSSLKPPGVESVPKKPIRPGRVHKFETEVGALENIRDATLPSQPQFMSITEKGEFEIEGQLVVWDRPEPSNAVCVRHAQESILPQYTDMALQEHLTRLQEVPRGIQQSVQKMQAHMRGYLTRKQMREFVASVTIQAHFRGWQARRKYGPSLQHAINTRNSKFSQDENQIHPQGRRSLGPGGEAKDVKIRQRFQITPSILPPM